MEFTETAERLRGRLFLSSMMGWCDPEFCASRSKGCAMVQLGAYVMLKEHKPRDTYWPDPERGALTAFFREQFDRCRARAAELVGAKNVPLICANVFPCTDEDVAVSAAAFVDAGGDIYELNAHGGIGNDRKRGTGGMLFLPQHAAKLMRWAKILVDAGGRVIIKGRSGVIPDFAEHARRFEQIGVHAFHVNVRAAKAGEQDVRVLELVRRATGMFVLASGYVTDTASARRLFDAGADCVGIAEAATTEPDVFVRCGGACRIS